MKNIFLVILCILLPINTYAQDLDQDGLLDSMEYGSVDGVETSEIAQPSIECDGNVFQIYGAPSQLAKVDFNAGNFINLGNTSHGQRLNAAGYNSSDGYIYAINRGSPLRDVVRIGMDGSVGSIGEIEGLPKYNYVAGAFGPNSIYYVSDYGWLYGIDVVAKKVVSAIPLTKNPKGAEIDLTYDKVRDVFYATSSGKSLSKINYRTGELTEIGNVGFIFGALVSDSYGNVYGIDNGGSGLYKVNVNNASVARISDAPGAGQNDAAMCFDTHLFLDTDDDGIDDEYDPDADGDGLDNTTDCNGYEPTGDEDGDSIPNWTDSDDQGDDGDGSRTDYTDLNQDGIPDVFDTDGDGKPNHKDTDSDNDNILDLDESTTDTDGDGTPDFLDTDSDNDGVFDIEEGGKDTDGDGISDYIDTDDDNDGIPTILDDCPLCNFADDVMEFNYLEANTYERWGVHLEQYKHTRKLWAKIREQLHCDDENTRLEEAKKGFNEDSYLIKQDSEVIVTAIFDGAINNNTLYWYDGRETEPKLNKIWNAFVMGPDAPLIPGSSKSLGIFPAGTKLRFAVTSSRGGRLIYQEAFRNGSGNSSSRELFSGKLLDDTIAAFEDNPMGGDHDYNDVVIKLSILPRNLDSVGDGSTQHDNTILGQSGMKIDRGSRGVKRRAGDSVENTMQLIDFPEGSSEYTLTFKDDRSPFKFSLGVFDWSLVSNLDRQSLAFRKIVGNNYKLLLDDRSANPKLSVTFNPQELGLDGKTVSLIYMPNNVFRKFMSNPFRYTPKGNGNNTKRQPLFSINSANPGHLDQMLSFDTEDSTLLFMEDKTRYNDGIESGSNSNNSFDDIQLEVSPKLEGNMKHNTYYIDDADVTENFTSDDGFSEGRKGDY